ncbi:MAG: OmpH family outer membrane protein [bacterium]
MKRWKYVLAAVLFLSMHAVAQAQALKIGLVDFQKALNDVEEGKRAKASLKAQFEQKQNALTAKQDSLKTLKDQLETQRAALSPEAMKAKEAEYRDKFLDLQKTLTQFRSEIATKEAEMTQSIITKMRGVVQSVGQKGGYNLIFETSQDAVLYAPGATDLTAQVVAAYNSGAGSAPAK